MELRGYDSYEVTLGDELRGERASLNKSLEDVERDLRIKARMIIAIEECDLSGFSNQSVISGYVRSYARYLGLDVDDTYRRFCEASGFRSPASLMSKSGDGSAFGSLAQPLNSNAGTEIAASRFAAPPSRNRFRARIPLGAVASGMALVALVAGLSYGGYSLLQDIQRVGIAPVPEAPAVVASVPTLGSPGSATEERPSAGAYLGGGALAAVPEPSRPEIAPPPRRDGPISAIDPRRASIFIRDVPEEPPATALAAVAIDVADTRIYLPSQAAKSPVAVEDVRPETSDNVVTVANKPAAPVETGIKLLATGPAWIKVSERDSSTIWQGTLAAGEEVALPMQMLAATMRSGNAGGTFVILNGVVYGPLGQKGRVVKNVSLLAEDIRASLPIADPGTFARTGGETDAAVARAQD